MTSGNGLAITYTAFNKPESITRGSNQIVFSHDSEHSRIKQVNTAGTTLYLNGSGVMSERLIGSGGAEQWTDYLFAGGEMIGMRVEDAASGIYTRYFHKDHLGSITAITDEAGAVVERLSYDAWGKRRNLDGTDDAAGALTSQTTRGFTGHEQLTEVGLVHMNGRVYDPLIGRFGAPDPMTESPYSTQGWNRYSYVGNSPLNFADPSGYCFAGCFWQKPFQALGAAIRRNPILGNILQVAAVALCTGGTFGACAPFAPAVAGLASAAVTGLASGDIGPALKAGVITAVTAGAFNAAGTLTQGLPPLANIAAHAAIGCGSAVLSGGDCKSGALSAGVSSFSGHALPDFGFTGNLIARSVVGGLSSVAGGGKFGNGALTAAFGYLLNEELHKPKPLKLATFENCEPGVQCLDYVEISSKNEDWKIQWQLRYASEAGGWIVQRVDALQGIAKLTYWEAWPVSPGEKFTNYVASGAFSYDDHFSMKSVEASARYYEGLELPITFDIKTNSVGGILRHTFEDPKILLNNATPPVNRSYTRQ